MVMVVVVVMDTVLVMVMVTVAVMVMVTAKVTVSAPFCPTLLFPAPCYAFLLPTLVCTCLCRSVGCRSAPFVHLSASNTSD